jgi:metal-sulfur cluster biosynthetic enzyme
MESTKTDSIIEYEIYDVLKAVIDPEIGINIVDLGLVYLIEYNKEHGITIKVTLTTRGCPMGDAIMGNIEYVINEKFPDIPLNLELVWEPQWTADLITPAGKAVLDME